MAPRVYYYPRPPRCHAIGNILVFIRVRGSRPTVTPVSDRVWPLASHAQRLQALLSHGLCDKQEPTIYKIIGQRPIPRPPTLQKKAEFCHSGTGTQCQCQNSKNSASFCRIGGLGIGLWPIITRSLTGSGLWPHTPPSVSVPEFTWPKLHNPSLVTVLWNINDLVMLGMAQFLDYGWDSDEDFEESNRQGREKVISRKHS